MPKVLGITCALPHSQVPFIWLTTKGAPLPWVPPALQLPGDMHDTELSTSAVSGTACAFSQVPFTWLTTKPAAYSSEPVLVAT
jgi:hypothetical protein